MNVWELFCCSGGMSEGFRRAGLPVTLAFDWDTNACASYEKNLGHRPIQIDARDLRRLASEMTASRQIDLWIFDPPCTPWSRAGKRKGTDDPRDMLTTTVELIESLRPTTWLIGNVPGLDDATNADVLRRTMGRLSNSYCIDYRRLDAASYGVPQHRVRPFWFGHPKQSDCIRWQPPTHCDPDLLRQLALFNDARKPWVTCRDALQHLDAKEIGRPLRIKPRGKHPPSELEEPAQTILTGTPRDQKGGAVLARPNWKDRKSGMDEPTRTIDARLEWPWDRPATGIACDERLQPPGHNDSVWKARSGPNAIALSEKAGAILQGFPEDWIFVAKTKTERWSMLGQAMPPALAQAVAESIKRWFSDYKLDCIETVTDRDEANSAAQ